MLNWSIVYLLFFNSMTIFVSYFYLSSSLFLFFPHSFPLIFQNVTPFFPLSSSFSLPFLSLSLPSPWQWRCGGTFEVDVKTLDGDAPWWECSWNVNYLSARLMGVFWNLELHIHNASVTNVNDFMLQDFLIMEEALFFLN